MYLHNDGNGINLNVEGKVNGVDIKTTVALSGNVNVRRQLIKMFHEDKQKALKSIGDTIQVNHFGIDKESVRHPTAYIK